MKKIILIFSALIFSAFFNFILFAAGSGDVNNDGLLDIVDALLIAQYYVGLNPPGFIYANADISDDGRVDIVDALLIAQIYVNGPSTTSKILIPHQSWTCQMAQGIPKPENGTLVCELNMNLGQVYNLGQTQFGQRQVCIIQGGTITGTQLSGSVMSGGLDFQLELSNGVMEIEQILVLRTNQGNYIYLRYAGTGLDQNDIRMVPYFEAPTSSSYNWLNSGKYAGRRVIDTVARTMKVSVYDISAVPVNPNGTNSFTITKPTNVPNQPWNYRVAGANERRGNQFITENVTLGGSQSVGATRDGRNRNIIPITGGTVTGNLTATILAAGADYQNLSNPATIDARYLWQANNGDVIIVRNAGPFGSLVPTFEVRANSMYSYINNTLYLSSDPGGGSGGVSITFYESTM